MKLNNAFIRIHSLFTPVKATIFEKRQIQDNNEEKKLKYLICNIPIPIKYPIVQTFVFSKYNKLNI